MKGRWLGEAKERLKGTPGRKHSPDEEKLQGMGTWAMQRSGL